MINYKFLVDERSEIVVAKRRDLVHFVRGAESVKEVQEGNPRFQGRCLRDERKIGGFLNRIGSKHRKTGGARGHYVAVIAKNRKCMRGHRTGRNMNHGGSEFPCDLVHIGDHQEKTLRCGKCRPQTPCLQRSVQGASRPTFTLHLNNGWDCAPDVLTALVLPLIGPLAHSRRRCDRIDRNHFIEAIRNGCRSLVSV